MSDSSPLPPGSSPGKRPDMSETLTTPRARQEIDARRRWGDDCSLGSTRVTEGHEPGTLPFHPRPGASSRPRRDPLPSRSSARLGALTVVVGKQVDLPKDA